MKPILLATSLVLLLLILNVLTNGSTAFTFPDTTGKYVTGVHDSEFVDTEFPSNFQNDVINGRRIMYRVYYPICDKLNTVTFEDTADDDDGQGDGGVTAICQRKNDSTGLVDNIQLGIRRRKYFEFGEWEAYYGYPEPTDITDTFDLTHSYLDAVPVVLSSKDGDDNDKPFPVMIYTHGFGMYVNDNTALLEEIASHGYIVFAIASPGYASGILFPNTGDVITAMNDYPEINETLSENIETVPSPYMEPFSDDLTVRYQKNELYLEEGAMPSLTTRVRDDMLALANYLDSNIRKRDDEILNGQETETTTTTFSRSSSTDTILKDNQLVSTLLGSTNLSERGVVYMGFSLGGSAAGSAAHYDTTRARGAINFDGGHQNLDLFGTNISVPYMGFMSNINLIPFFYNEWFFEEIETMGTRKDIVRVLVSSDGVGVSHLDFMDYKFLDQSIRTSLLGLPPVDGDTLHSMTVDFSLGFLNTYLRNDEWEPNNSFDKFPNYVEPIDVSYVATWANGEDSIDPISSSSYHLTTSVIGFASILALYSMLT